MFVGREGPDVELFEASTDGTRERLIAVLGRGRPGTLVQSSFDSDGRYIYFSWRESAGDIWVMDVAGDDGGQ